MYGNGVIMSFVGWGLVYEIQGEYCRDVRCVRKLPLGVLMEL